MTGHELDIETVRSLGKRPLKFVGTCECGKFKVTGPPDLIRDFHAAHLLYPDTKLTATASR